MNKIEFDILNYIDLRGPEVKEIFKTIENMEGISYSKLTDYYVPYKEEEPGYFQNAVKLLKQIQIVNIEIKNDDECYRSSPNFPDLPFELNFINHISKLEGKYKLLTDIYNELIRKDQVFMKQSDFQPWFVENFGDRYNMTKNKANFWVNIMDYYGFLQKLKFGNENYVYYLPQISHYFELFRHYYQEMKKEQISIRDFTDFISSHFFEAYTFEKNLASNFQDWLYFMQIEKNFKLRNFSDADAFKVRNQKFSHIEIEDGGLI